MFGTHAARRKQDIVRRNSSCNGSAGCKVHFDKRHEQAWTTIEHVQQLAAFELLEGFAGGCYRQHYEQATHFVLNLTEEVARFFRGKG